MMKKNHSYFLLVILLCYSGIAYASSKADSLVVELQKEQSDSSLITNHFLLAKAYRNNDLLNAIKQADLGAQLALSIHDSIYYAEGTFLAGTYYTELGFYRNAFDKLKEALAFFESANDYEKIIKTKVNIGNVFWFESDYEMALVMYNDAFMISQQSDGFLKTPIQMNKAICYSRINQPDSTFLIFDEIKKDLPGFDKGFERALVYLNFGSSYLLHNHYDSAIHYLNLSYAIKDDLPQIIQINLMASLTQCYLRMGNSRMANVYLDSCHLLVDSVNHFNGLKEYYAAKFEMDTTNKHYRDAVQSLLALTRVNDTLYKRDQEELLNNYKVYYNANIKETQIQTLKKDNELIRIKSNRNKLIILALFLIISLSWGLMLVFIRLNRAKAKSINTLHDLNLKLANQQNELSQKNRELEQTLNQLTKTQAQLVQSEKLASIGVLAAGVAHEINNPLNYINGGLFFLKDMKSKIDQYPEIAHNFNRSYKMMLEGVQKANKVVKTLGVYAFDKNFKNQHFKLSDAIDSAIASIDFKIKGGIQLQKELKPIPEFSGDIDKVKTIIIQLLSNAIDALRNRKELKERLIKIKAFLSKIDDKEYITLSISNNGENIAMGNINRLFDPFFTTKDPDKGYGLGLSITYNLVRDMSGNIMVNNLKNGVEFVVMFPV